MDAFIGRNSTTNQLLVKINGREMNLGDENTVPTTVSEMHCQLHVGPNEKMKLVNLKPGLNYTWVNGNVIEEMTVEENSRIGLGPDEWSLDLKMVLDELRSMGYLEKRPVSIAHLEEVYKRNHDKMFEVQVKQSRFQALRSITGILSPIAILIGFYLGAKDSYITLLIYVLLVGSGIFFFLQQWKDSKRLLLLKEDIKNEFEKNYVCPNPECHRFLGSQSFDEVKKMKRCPHCLTPFKES